MVTATAFAQASTVGGQGGSCHLQRFRSQYPPTFMGGGDSIVVGDWFMQVKKILEAMEITSDTTKIKLVAFQLESEA